MTKVKFLGELRKLLARGVEGVGDLAYVYLASSTDGVADEIKLILERQGVKYQFSVGGVKATGKKAAARGPDREAGDTMLLAIGDKLEQDKT